MTVQWEPWTKKIKLEKEKKTSKRFVQSLPQTFALARSFTTPTTVKLNPWSIGEEIRPHLETLTKTDPKGSKTGQAGHKMLKKR